METKMIQVEVPVATDKLGNELKNFIVACEQALADGWQTGQDLPVIVSSAVTNLIPAIGDFKAAGADFAADPVMASKAALIQLSDCIAPLVKKPVASPQA